MLRPLDIDKCNYFLPSSSRISTDVEGEVAVDAGVVVSALHWSLVKQIWKQSKKHVVPLYSIFLAPRFWDWKHCSPIHLSFWCPLESLFNAWGEQCSFSKSFWLRHEHKVKRCCAYIYQSIPPFRILSSRGLKRGFKKRLK